MSLLAARSLFWPLLLAAGIRLLCLVFLTPSVPIAGDSNGYVVYATHLREHGELLSLETKDLRPPLYFTLISPGLRRLDQAWDNIGIAFLHPFPGVYLIQIAFDLGACALLMSIANRRFSRRAALAAGYAYALLPGTFLYAASVVMSEPIAGFFAALGLFCYLRLDDALARPDQGIFVRALLFGLSLGLAVQSRGLMMLLVAAAFAATLVRPPPWRRRIAALAIAGVTVLAVFTPYGLYTKHKFGVALPTGTYGHMALMYDNVPEGRNGYHEYRAPPTHAERVALCRETFIEFLTGDPSLFALRAGSRVRSVLGPDVYLPLATIAYPFEGFIPDLEDPLAYYRSAWTLPAGTWGRKAQILSSILTLLFLSLGVGGLVAERRSSLGRLLLWWIGIFFLVVALTVALDRYRHGLYIGLTPFVGVALATITRPGDASPERRRAVWIGFGATAALLTVTMLLSPPP